ncbi:B12 binding domain-containing protein [Cnuella takakiae]|uniref:B12 binding domain-containing protein n=1 Tax=Cnuella takakiae TaxID=1302690 RepID=A0A1M4UZ65_9BACT|nr:MerR family transcriptional regulator [Cnuella takakiae]SHE61940.1 B12 binding domain-containing protein [Cnuella takakiae]
MQQFSIKDVEHLLGIKAHTLRVWEQRYGFFAAKRKASTHRTYDNEDLKVLLRVAFLYHQGKKISHIAALSPEALEQEVANVPLNGDTYPLFVVQLVEHALAFDELAFAQLLDRVTNLIGFTRTIEEVCFPFLQRVGLLWMTNHMVPAQEHFSSYLIQNKIIAATESIPLPGSPTEMILFAPKGEFHELPLLYLHYLLRNQGWSVMFLGKNVDIPVLKECAAQPSVQYLFMHLLTNLNQMDPEDYLEELVRQFPVKSIIASGAGIHRVKRSFVNVHLLLTDKQIHQFINRKDEIPKYIIKVPPKSK